MDVIVSTPKWKSATVVVVAVVMLTLTPALSLGVRADTSTVVHTIFARTTTHLGENASPGRRGRISPNSIQTDLGGGVTAYSDAGLQYREGFFLVDASGIASSTTNYPISEMEVHGVLIHSYSRTDCLFGDNLWILNSVYGYNTAQVNPGWGPWVNNISKTNCITMASGHYYIYNGARTDVSGPDVSKVY